MDMKLTDLAVVGYAEVIPDSMLPCVVPPVFASKGEPYKAYLPPYHMTDGVLCNAHEVSWAEAVRLAERDRITFLDLRFDAIPDFELWLDQHRQIHYQDDFDAELVLDRIADEKMREAEEAFAAGDFAEAERLSSVSANANDRNLAPFALQAAMDRLRGNHAGEAVMAEVATNRNCLEQFNALVAKYLHQRSEGEVE